MNLKKGPYLSILTPLRGIAALLVVIFHSDLMLKAFVPPGVTKLISHGWLWVDFFFILSGFILSYVYGKIFQEKLNWATYKKYIGSRFARVYPLHFFTLIIALIGAITIIAMADSIDPFFAALFDPWTAPASLLLLQGMPLFTAGSLNSPSWSLSTEWWMYMVFPFLVPFFSRLKGTGKVFTFLFIAMGYVVLMYYVVPLIPSLFGKRAPTINVVKTFAFLRCALGFLLGMLFQELYKNNIVQRSFKNTWTFVALFAGVLMAMHFAIHELLIIAFFPFIILAAAYNETHVLKVFNMKIFQRLGDWSFSIYMVHVPIIYGFWIFNVYKNPKFFSSLMAMMSMKPDYVEGFLKFCIFLPLTLISAALTYRYIEVPARNYLNARFKKDQKPEEEQINTEEILAVPIPVPVDQAVFYDSDKNQ
jgi:peptidoglycan/LPS O-acetylase OafA/YrhL